jgi:hypothetical protein
VAAHVPLPEAPVDTRPWSFADPNTIRQVLDDTGFYDVRVEAWETRLRVGTDADDVLAFYLFQLLPAPAWPVPTVPS